ncbi:MAG: hypothetical protein M1828_004766 [Chrysothrix sp. TS-e1954]|nr:MAG: hypothetical protein M1828_004766 [Chrysothrix sp. TS-e1954]
MSARDPPINVVAKDAANSIENAAAFIFIHGFGDDASGLENIAHQFQAANKLPHLEWIFPNALENRDAMEKAWYTPSSLTPFPSSRPELDDPEDELGMLQSVKYIESLIEKLTTKGIPLDRIVIGGFSQGCAMSLLINLISANAGRLAGVVGICGYLPLAECIVELRSDAGVQDTSGKTPIFLARGTRDMLVPRRYYSMCVQKLKELGVGDDLLEAHEYEGMGHGMTGPVLRDACAWLEKVVPHRE